MGGYSQLGLVRTAMRRKTEETFPELLDAVREAIELLIDATEVLVNSGARGEHRSPEGASRSAVWRFLSTLPSSATWCLEASVSGDSYIAKALLRLCLEEAVKLAYYGEQPAAALRQVMSGKTADETEIDEMIRALAPAREKEYMRLWGHLSNLYVHANLNLPPELIYEAESGEPQIGGGPRFDPQLFQPIAEQLLAFIVTALFAAARRFPELSGDSKWAEKVHNLVDQSERLAPTGNAG